MTASDEDLPLAGLPPAEVVLLLDAQIEIVALEVRYSGPTTELTSDQGLALRGRLVSAGIPISRMEPAKQQELQMTIGPDGVLPSMQTSSRGWQFSSIDNSLVFTVMPNLMTIQTTIYKRWSESLGGVLRTAVEAVAAVVKPELRHRIGLRYVNRLADKTASSPEAWIGRVSEFFIGPIADPIIGHILSNIQQQAEIRLGENLGALLRHGLLPDPSQDGAYSYLVDIDVYDQSTDAFDVATLLLASRPLNRTALSLFQLVVSDEYRKTMKPIPLSTDLAQASAPMDSDRP